MVDLGSGMAYLFKGDAFVRVDQSTNRVDGEVRSIADGWAGFADAGFADSLDASVNWGNGKAYFFRGADYIRYDIATDRVDDGYPLQIAENWPGFGEAGLADGVDAAVNWGNGTRRTSSAVACTCATTSRPTPWTPASRFRIDEQWPGFEAAGFGLRLDAGLGSKLT